MAEPTFLKDAAIFLGGYDFSGFMNSVNLSGAKGEKPSSVFGDSAETFFPGLIAVTAEGGGFWNSESALAPDPVLFSRINPAITPASWPLLVVPPNAVGVAANTEGNFGYEVVGNQFAYSLGGQHGELLPFNFKTLPSSGNALHRKRVERAKASVTATTTSTGFQYGALSATQKMVATLHVFNISGTGAWTLTIQSDDNGGFSSPTTRLTFAQVTQAVPQTFEVKSAAGAIADDFWRAILTEDSGTSTITFAVSLGIANLN